VVVDDALIEAVLGPRRFEGHSSAGGSAGAAHALAGQCCCCARVVELARLLSC
jgi:hypothetical protein